MAKPWTLTPYEALEAPAVSVLFYHNPYEEGKQGGLEILQQAVRIAGNGSLRLAANPDQWRPLPKNGVRRVIDAEGAMEVEVDYPDAGIHATVRLAPDGNRLRLTVDLAEPLPAEWIGKAGFNLELMPGAFMGKAYHLDGAFGQFPRQFGSPVRHSTGTDELDVQPLASGNKLITAPDDPSSKLEIECLSGELALLDGRASAQNGWFVVRSLIPAGATRGAVEWLITPYRIPTWIRPPVILISQVGYASQQRKVAVIELDSGVQTPASACLFRIEDHEEKLAKSERLKLWGSYLCFSYAQLDFSEITQPGLYVLEYEDKRSPVFPIGPQVYQQGVWQPTLEDYFPVQMCHMEVRHGYRVWHGLCHMDDALQAPLNQRHFDGYVQYDTTDTSFDPYQPIPHLNQGGWHDAGDYDLAAGSQAHTTHILALAREAFHVDSDQTTVLPEEHKVIMHVPDGSPDILQQVAHGAENLLSGYRASGHSFTGIIENNLRQYVHMGDPATMTDNQVTPGASSDDRWAFTDRNTALEYQVAAALAASARVLRGWKDALAQECLDTAVKAWDFEHSHPPKTQPNAYFWNRPDFQEVGAAAELLLTTGEERYRQSLLSSAGLILDNAAGFGWLAARVLPLLKDDELAIRLRQKLAAHAAETAEAARHNPFGVPYTDETWRKQAPVWGVAWNFLSNAVKLYYLRQAYPDLFSRDLLSAILGYVLGCHPVSSASLVSGVGARSLTSAYGINRADWTYIPGGVVSGPALIRPNYPELLDPFPFLWSQKEYVMGGAADYLFTALAVEALHREA